jgi:DNA-binding response OmpR family regulator
MANYTILIVDYEPRNVRHLSEFLEGAGFSVRVANDGPSGEQAFERFRPDLTLIEIMLPRRSGFEVCRGLKRTDHGQRSLVVMMTSRFRSRTYRSQALYQYGADGYLEKPVPPDQLQKILDNLTLSGVPETAGVKIDQSVKNALVT